MDFISSDQALELLKSNPEHYTTPDSIRGLISRVDMNIPGEITLLYSGSYTDGGIKTSANDIVQAMARNGDDIRIINNTQVAKLLDTQEFVTAAGKAENGLWADASRRFAAETVGEVHTLATNTRNNCLHT